MLRNTFKLPEELRGYNEAMWRMYYKESTLSIGIFKNNILVDCNPQTTRFLRGTKRDIIGKSIFDLTFYNDSNKEKKEKELLRLIEKCKNGEQPIVEWDVRRLDNTFVRTELILQSFIFEGEIYLSFTGKDISRRLEKEEKLLERQKKLELKIDNLLSPKRKISDVNLLDLIDIEQINELSIAFSGATGLASSIIDAEGSKISEVISHNNICSLIRSTSKGKELCEKSEILLNNKIKESFQPEWHNCLSCSFLDAAAPIVVDGNFLGSWWIGRALPEYIEYDKLLNMMEQLGIKKKVLYEELGKVKRIKKKEFESALHLLRVLANELSNLAYNNLKLAKTLNDHKRMEKKLETARLKAEESDRLKSAFLANMSHEIRTPMNGIIGFTELIRNPDIEPIDRDVYISVIQESSNQLLNIINDIIDISKIESGQIEAFNEKIILRSLMDELLLFFSPMAEKKGIQLKCENCIECNKELYADKVKLKQILSNLISNAIKFTTDGCVSFWYELKDENYLCFKVKDTGIGISVSDQKRIFNRFWQVGKKASNSGGTGLGLTITKAYVELMGGKIWLESKINEGTTFCFTIPTSG